MAVHQVYETQLTPLLRAEFIYETSPVVAGTNDLSLIVRFRYTGVLNKQAARTPEAPGEPETNSWFGSRLSMQLSNATRALFVNQMNGIGEEGETLVNQKSKSSKVELVLGFHQLLGYYNINDSYLNFDIFKDLQRSTIIEGKMAGIHGLEVSTNTKSNETESLGVLSSLGTLYNTELSSLENLNIINHVHTIPFFSSDQNIMFSSLVFDPSQWDEASFARESTKSFYLTAKLPENLPPTYKSDPIQITYNFVFGYQIWENSQLVNKTIFVPLKLQPFLDENARQPIFHLENAELNVKLENVKSVDVTSHPSVKRLEDSGSKTRRISFWNIKNKSNDDLESRRPSSATTFDSLKRMSISDMKDIKGTENIEKFMEILDKMQTTNVNDIVELQDSFDKEFMETKKSFNVRENIIHILGDSRKTIPHDHQHQDAVEESKWEYLLPVDIQRRFVIKQNHHLISTLSLNKCVFKVGDSISLNLSFDKARYYTTGIEIQLIKKQHFFRKEYIKLDNYDNLPPNMTHENALETVLFEALHSTMNTKNFNSEIIIPSATEPQFKCNFFSVNYYVQVKFIMSNVYNLEGAQENEESLRQKFDLKNIFTDEKGSLLYQPVEAIYDANSFTARIPIFLLSNYEMDFGRVTALQNV